MKSAAIWRTAAATGVAVPILLLAYSTGPDPRHTGAPGDFGTCVACHTGLLNPSGGSVIAAFVTGLTYEPGVKQRILVTVSGPGSKRWGFQMTARLASNEANGQAGDFTTLDGNTQVLCDDGSPKPNGKTCSASASVQFIEHTSAGTVAGNSFTFDWTPPATNVGNVRFYVAGNAANADGTNRGDQIYTANYTLTPTPPSLPPVVSSGGIADAFNYQVGVASATFISLFGQNLAPVTRDWNGAIIGNQLPKSINGVSVAINRLPAVILAISPTQVNVLAPNDFSEGDVLVVLTNPAGSSAPLTVKKTKYLPAFYAPYAQGGKLYVTTVQAETGEILGTPGVDPRAVRPVRPGEVVLLYGTGFGQATPEMPLDSIPPNPAQLAVKPQILIGETQAGFVENGYMVSPGFTQFNLTVPLTLFDGEYPLKAIVDGVESSIKVFITVKR